MFGIESLEQSMDLFILKLLGIPIIVVLIVIVISKRAMEQHDFVDYLSTTFFSFGYTIAVFIIDVLILSLFMNPNWDLSQVELFLQVSILPLSLLLLPGGFFLIYRESFMFMKHKIMITISLSVILSLYMSLLL